MEAKERKEHLLVFLGKKRFNEPKAELVVFVRDEKANALLNDFTNFPHAYVLACCMDRQVKAEIAWMIPAKIQEILGSFSIEVLDSLRLDDYLKLFNDHKLHRFNDVMATVFHNAVRKIADEYSQDASKIWRGNPSSAAVVYRFLQFDGVGPKIATMATNILARDFKIPMSDYYSIDVSTDVHILRVLRRSGLVSRNADADSVVYKARELNPEFPGIIDFSCWEIGRTWCRPKRPDCQGCPMQSVCQKNL